MKKPEDVGKLRKGTKIKNAKGEELFVKGAYMGTNGIVLMVTSSPGAMTCIHVPLDMVDDVMDANS